MSKTYLLLIITLLLASCSSDRGTGARLHIAEALMEERPDSALAILREISPEHIRSARNRALHGLLLTQALDKNYIDVFSDSTINTAVEFFEKSKEVHYLIASLYYQGNIYYNQKAYSESLVPLFKAYNYAHELKDHYWIAITARRISDIYHDNFNGSEELAFSEIAYENFKVTGKRDFIIYSLMDLGKAYITVEDYNKSLAISHELQDSAVKYNLPHIFADGIRLNALSLLGSRNYKESVKLYSDLCNTRYANATDSAYLALALLYNGDVHNARSIADKLNRMSSKIYNNLNYRLSLAADSLQQALAWRTDIDLKTDSLLKSMVQNNLSGALIRYHNYEKELSDAKLSKAKMISYIIILIVLLLMICGCFSYIIISRKLKKKTLLSDIIYLSPRILRHSYLTRKENLRK